MDEDRLPVKVSPLKKKNKIEKIQDIGKTITIKDKQEKKQVSVEEGNKVEKGNISNKTLIQYKML